jgi:hypothetical protein
MRRNPFLDFHQTAEAAGYPALLIVSLLCLGLVVLPVALLGLTGAGWLLALALLSLVAAVSILTGAIDAAMSDADEPRGAHARPTTPPAETDSLAPGAPRQLTGQEVRHVPKAA